MKFKTNIGLALIFGAIIAISLTACPPEEGGGGIIEPTVTYTVSFVSNGGSEVSPILNVVEGTTINWPAPPTSTVGGVTLNRFRGWYKDDNTFAEVWNFASDTVTGPTTLYADWGYRLGDAGPGTGIIFHRSNLGFAVEGYTGATGSFEGYTAYYLEAAPEDSGLARWSAIPSTIISGITTFGSTPPLPPIATAIGNGRKDTLTIAAFLASQVPPETGRAAQVALAASFGNRYDWFLPSKGESDLLFQQRNLPGLENYIGTWNSSQHDSNNAWGFGNPAGKDGNLTVHAIRAF